MTRPRLNKTKDKTKNNKFRLIAPLNAIKAVLPCMSHEETHYYLNGVYVDCSADGDKKNIIKFTATDGHVLAVTKPTSIKIEGTPRSFIIPRQTIEEVLAVEKAQFHKEYEYDESDECDYPIKKEMPERLVLVDMFDGYSVGEIILLPNMPGTPTQILDFDKARNVGSVIFSFKAIDGTFPDYKRVIPDPGEWVEKFGIEKLLHEKATEFNPSFLGRFSSFGRYATFYFNPETNSPSLIRAASQEFEALGVIMPARGDKLQAIPDWVGLKKETKKGKKK